MLILAVIGSWVVGVAFPVIGVITSVGSLALSAGGTFLQIPQRRIKDVDDMIADVKKVLHARKAKALPPVEGQHAQKEKAS